MFEGAGGAENDGVFVGAADDLEANGEAARVETAGD